MQLFQRLLVIAILSLAAGCNTGPTSSPPGGASIVSSGLGFNFTYEHWNEGLSVLIIDDLAGSHGSHGSGSTAKQVYTADGYGGNDPQSYKWHLETSDGKTAKFQINATDYDLSNGSVFVVRWKDGRAEVQQFKRDMSTIPFEAFKCREALDKDAQIQKALGR